MKRSINRLFYLGVILLSSSFSYAEDIVLYTMHFPPYSIDSHIVPPDKETQLQNGLYGVDVELIRAAYNTQGIQVTYKMGPWKRMVRDVREGLALGVVSCRPIESRKPFSFFSNAVSYSTMVFATRKGFLGDQPSYPLQTLKRYHTIVNAGWAQEAVLSNAHIPYTVVNGMEQGASLVLHRNQDVFMTDKESLVYALDQMNERDQFSFYNIDAVDYKDYTVCFSKKFPNSERLRDALNKGLQVLRTTGQTQALYKKYGIVDPSEHQ